MNYNALKVAHVIQAAAPQLMTVANVEICATGVEYQLASGTRTFTPEDLADAVASQDDPAIVAPRIKIGHVDPRFNTIMTPDGIMDGEPALGTVQDLRLSADGHTIFGDYVGVPAWLAQIMASAYPSRSIEGGQGVETVTGHKWRLVITDVALLGVVWPGVSTLEDIQQLYSENGPDGLMVVEAVTATGGEPMDRRVVAAPITAAVNVDDVRRQYYDGLSAEQMWWWIRAIYLNPNELIVDDDDGQMYRVPFTVSGDSITFSDPTPVQIQYVDQAKDKTKASVPLPLLPGAGQVTKVYASRAESRPGTPVQGGQMDPAEIRSLLGLAPDASDDEVRQAMQNRQPAATGDGATPPAPAAPPAPAPAAPAPASPPATPATPAPAAEPGAAPEAPAEAPATPAPGEPAPAAAPAPETAAAAAPPALPPGYKVISEEDLKSLQAGVAAAQTVVRTANETKRDDKITAAIKAGKFPPAQREHYQRMWDGNAEGTEQFIDSLADNVVPVEARGVNPATGETTDQSEYPAEWAPDAAARRQAIEAAQQNGNVITHPRVMSEA